MRWFKFSVLILLVLFGIYAAVMYFFADESKSFTVEKEIDYPVEKVFPQFSNLQNFVRWNDYFSSQKLSVDYFRPYEGQGSALAFRDKEHGRSGEMYIRYQNPRQTLRYQLFENDDNTPYLIDIRFVPVSDTRTRIVWFVHTPKLPLLKRSANFWTEEDFVDDLSRSMVNLKNILSNKVDRDEQLNHITYDSLIVEKYEGSLLLGVNVSTSNKKDALFKNIVLNHNKVYNYVTVDLGKHEDEIGLPILITDPSNFREKEVSYFYGIPLSRKMGITDNNFSFRTVNPSKIYSIYFKGNYSARQRPVSELLQKARRDTLRSSMLMETFIVPPEDGKDVIVKFSLPVYR